MRVVSLLKSSATPVDQIFSSVSNGMILFALAVVATVRDFGIVSLLFTLMAAALGIMRGALGNPLLLAADGNRSTIRRHGRRAVAVAAVAGSLGAVVLAVAGTLLGGGAAGWVLALALPVVLMQDTLRYVAISMGRAHLAAVWDAVWCAGSFGLLVAAWCHSSWLTTEAIVTAWLLLAAVSLTGLAVSLRVVPLFTGTSRWARADWPDRIRYGTDAGLEQVTFFLVLLIGMVFIGHTGVAALRGATAALAPLAILASAIPLLVIPSATRAGVHPRRLWSMLARVAVVTSICSLAAGVVLYVLPQSVGALFLGDSYDPARGVVLFMAGEYSVTAWLLVIGVYLRSANRSADVLQLKMFAVSLTLLGSFVGAALIRTPEGLATFYLTATVVTVIVALSWFTPWRSTQWHCGLNAAHHESVDEPDPTVGDGTALQQIRRVR